MRVKSSSSADDGEEGSSAGEDEGELGHGDDVARARAAAGASDRAHEHMRAQGAAQQKERPLSSLMFSVRGVEQSG